MRPVLVIENCTQSLNKVNEQASSASGKDKYIMEGVFTQFNVVNRNNRLYTPDKFLPAFNELLERKKMLGVVFGEFDHPEIFDQALQRTSHVIENVRYDEKAQNINGSIRLLTTYWGKEARALVNDQCPIFVSSRAAGVTESDGSVKLHKLITYDIVADPGFSSAKMNLNESLGYSNDASTNFRIYDLGNDSDTNKLFEMNADDQKTKQILHEYSEYLTKQIKEVRSDLTGMIRENRPTEDVSKTIEKFEVMSQTYEKVTEYLDYLSKKTLVAITESSKLKEDNKKLAEKLATMEATVNKHIRFTEYVAEKVKKNIEFTEYVAEHTKSAQEYAEYIKENLEKSVEFTEYVAEHVKGGIEFTEYVAENLKNSIEFIEYTAEHTKSALAYGQYLKENSEDQIAYTKYLANKVDGILDYQTMIAEKLNGSRLNEQVISIESPVTHLGLDKEKEELDAMESEEDGEEETDKSNLSTLPAQGEEIEDGEEDGDALLNPDGVQGAQGQPVQAQAQGQPAQAQAQGQPAQAQSPTDLGDMDLGDTEIAQPTGAGGETLVKIGPNTTGIVLEIDADGIKVRRSGSSEIINAQPEEIEAIDMEEGDDSENLTESIKRLIEEAKKRKASETKEPDFFKFLSESQIDDFKKLETNEQEAVIVALNESSYYSRNDVMNLMKKALTGPEPTFEETLVSNMPADLKPHWENLSNERKEAIYKQARLHNLGNEYLYENFWRSRRLEQMEKINESAVKSTIEVIKTDDVIDEATMRMFEDRFNSLR